MFPPFNLFVISLVACFVSGLFMQFEDPPVWYLQMFKRGWPICLFVWLTCESIIWLVCALCPFQLTQRWQTFGAFIYLPNRYWSRSVELMTVRDLPFISDMKWVCFLILMKHKTLWDRSKLSMFTASFNWQRWSFCSWALQCVNLINVVDMLRRAKSIHY